MRSHAEVLHAFDQENPREVTLQLMGYANFLMSKYGVPASLDGATLHALVCRTIDEALDGHHAHLYRERQTLLAFLGAVIRSLIAAPGKPTSGKRSERFSM